jgi:DNA-binding NarL/FixJ family response regulator
MRARLLIADRNTLVVEAFGKLLEPEFDVVATVTDGLTLLERATQLRPDVVILDLDLPKLNGMAAGKELRSLLPRTRVVVVTTSEDLERASQSLQQWASAYLLKKSTSSELIRAIHGALRGRTYVTPSVAQRLLESVATDPHADREPSMTIRQKQVLQLLAEGQTMKEIAVALAITQRTVAYHKYEIMRMHSLRSTPDIVMFALRQRIVPLPTHASL